MRIVIVVLSVLLIVLALFAFKNRSDIQINACIELCKKQLEEGEDLTKGPCLSNKISDGWVCDVAHNPRIEEDNNPENQCSEYLKSAYHFVEVDPNCNLIRAV